MGGVLYLDRDIGGASWPHLTTTHLCNLDRGGGPPRSDGGPGGAAFLTQTSPPQVPNRCMVHLPMAVQAPCAALPLTSTRSYAPMHPRGNAAPALAPAVEGAAGPGPDGDERYPCGGERRMQAALAPARRPFRASTGAAPCAMQSLLGCWR